MWQALISPIASLLGQALKNKAEEKKAVHDARMQVIQNTASWEQLMASASATSWKDEWFTLLLSAPVVALMWGIGMNDVEIIDRIGLAFSELNRLPDWYQYLLFMAVSASFGIRGADKLLALKGKKQMALELDIFQDTTANTMFADSTMAAEQEEQSTRTGSFQGTTYQDVLDWYEATGFGDRNPSDPSTYPNVVGSSYIVGEDGGYYNEAGEKLYWFDPPSELGRGGQSSLGDADNKGFYTEAQIRSYWDADQGMGYFKKANPDLTYEAYMGYLSERQALVESGDIAKLDGDELYRQGHKGRGPNADAINAIVLEERQRVNEQNAQLTSDLASKYGIQQVYQNSDGDVFRFNGSNYHKAFKVDDHDWSKVIGNIVVDYAIGAVTGQLANAFLGLVSPGTTIDSLIKGAASEFGMSIPDFINTAGVLGGISTVSGGYKEWNDIINSPEWSNVIVNLTGGPDSTPNQPFQGDGEGVDSDGNVVWNTRNLPSIYSIVNGDIVHTESGTVMSEGNYSVDRTQYVSFPPYKPDTEAGGGGAAEDPSASNDDTGASADSAGSEGSGIVNETGEEVTTGGEEVDGTGTQTGAEYRWKYIGNGCFVQIDENGVEIPGTKVCDPDYTEEDYSLYEVGGIFGRGTDVPFGSSDDEGKDTTSSYEPSPAGTDLGYECLPNGDKVVYTADGNGGSTTEVIKGGCLENEGTGGVIVTGGDDGDDSSGGTTDSTGDTATGEADEDADGDGTEGTGESGAGDDGVGDDGTGEGEGGDGNGDGEGNGITSPAVSGKGSYEGTVQGLSYVAQPVPGLMSSPPVDAMGELNNLISNQMKKRGMLV